MSIKIYNTEHKDGLGERISDNKLTLMSTATVVYDDLYRNDIDNLYEEIKNHNLSIASESITPSDLFPVRSILVSVGWNKNDDYFTPEELWKAKDTPVHKPFNLFHDQTDIIGHITGNYPINNQGQVITDLEDDFHIVSIAVMYKEWLEKDRKRQIAKIINEIENTDNWFVSMECSLGSFDYALKDSNGVISIVERTEITSHLTKHLRRYGGSGVYEGYQIARVLKDINFIGKGLVNKPANPNSIILKDKDFSSASEENEMTYTKEQYDALQAELATAKQEVDNLKSKLADETAKAGLIETVEAKVAKLEEEKASLESAKASVENEKAEIEAELNKVTSANEQLTSRVKELETEKTIASRVAMLAEAGVEDAESTVQELSDLSDTAFEKVVATLKKKAPKEDTSKADILDNLEEDTSKAGLNDIEGEEEESFHSTASEWFASILKSKTKK